MSERARGRRPRSPLREGGSSKDRKRRYDRERARERCQRARLNPTVSQEQRDRHASQTQTCRANMDDEARETQRANNTLRMQNYRANMDDATRETQRENNTSQRRNNRANMDDAACETERANNTLRMSTFRANMDDDARDARCIHNNIQERHCRNEREGETLATFNAERAMNQRRQRTFDPDRNVPDEDYFAFFQSCDENHPLDKHAYVKEMQDKFHNPMNASQMRHCFTCRERWMTKNCLDNPLDQYECNRCKTDTKGTPKRFSAANGAIPLTLVACPDLQDVADATVLECMLVSLACSVMRVARHIGTGSTVYQSHCVNFIQDISTFYTTNTIPRATRNTPYFYVKRTGSDGTVAEARVRRAVVRRLIEYLIQNNPLYANLNIDEQALQALPEDGIPPEIIIQVDNNNDDCATGEVNVGANNSIGNLETTVGLPVIQQQKSGAIVDALTELENNTMAERISQQTRERNQLAPAGGNEPTGPRFQWPQIGSEPLNEFTTEHLAAMCFPELFLNGAGDPTSSDRLRDVKETDFARHLIKFCVRTSDGKYVYPFAEHDAISY